MAFPSIDDPALALALGVPKGTHIDAVIPMGYPAGKLGKNKRLPVSEVAFREKFGQGW